MSGSLIKEPSELISLAKRGRSDEEIERDVDEIVKETLNGPKDHVIFTPGAGWIAPNDEFIGDTTTHLYSPHNSRLLLF